MLDKDQIILFPENDILPYDHFSMPERITKQRFEIINKNKTQKHVLITSIKNIFEKFPEKNFYKSFKTVFITKNVIGKCCTH